jgi:hypothetical protein
MLSRWSSQLWRCVLSSRHMICCCCYVHDTPSPSSPPTTASSRPPCARVEQTRGWAQWAQVGLLGHCIATKRPGCYRVNEAVLGLVVLGAVCVCGCTGCWSVCVWVCSVALVGPPVGHSITTTTSPSSVLLLLCHLRRHSLATNPQALWSCFSFRWPSPGGAGYIWPGSDCCCSSEAMDQMQRRSSSAATRCGCVVRGSVRPHRQ